MTQLLKQRIVEFKKIPDFTELHALYIHRDKSKNIMLPIIIVI